MGSVMRMTMVVSIRIARMKAQQKNWKWKVKCSLKNGAPIFLRVKVRFILLAGSTIVTLNVENKWVGVVFDDC
jgi:hypothetical protein